MQPTAARSPGPKFLTCSAGVRHAADNLVAGDARINRVVPFVARCVQVGVTHAAEKKLEPEVVRSDIAAIHGERCERVGGGGGAAGFDGDHGVVGSGCGCPQGIPNRRNGRKKTR